MGIRRWLYGEYESEIRESKRKGRRPADAIAYATNVLGWMILRNEADRRRADMAQAASKAQGAEAKLPENERRQAEVERWQSGFKCSCCDEEFTELHLNGQCYDCWERSHEMEHGSESQSS